MFIARNAYLGKAENYLRMYGTFTFGPGGAFHDIPWVIKRYGIVPEEVYQGLNYGSTTHKHSEMEAVLDAAVKALAKKPQNGKLTPVWKNGIEGILDAYLGELPSDIEDFNFTYNGKQYNPKSFSKSLGLNMDDYISITSFSHNPPVKERNITQEDRQIAFDNQETTDDHGMHVTGLVEDQKGTKYFIVKNSWGESNDRDGYFFASFPYVKYKTLNIQVHKDVLSKDLKKKLGIK